LSAIEADGPVSGIFNVASGNYQIEVFKSLKEGTVVRSRRQAHPGWTVC